MKNNKYLNLFIIVSVILLILYSIYYIFFNKNEEKKISNIEKYTNSSISNSIDAEFPINMIENGSFENGTHIKNYINQDGYNKIIKMKNPSKSGYVLEQKKSNDLTYYELISKSTPNSKYVLLLWVSFSNSNINSIDLLSLIRIRLRTNNQSNNIPKLNYNIVQKVEIDNKSWYLLQYNFITNEDTNDNMNIYINYTEKLQDDTIYFAGISMYRILTDAQNFIYNNGLVCYLDAYQYESNILTWHDLSGTGNDFFWSGIPITDYTKGSINTSNLDLKGPSSNVLLNNDEFTIVLVLNEVIENKSQENSIVPDFRYLLCVPGNNKDSFEISINKDNKLVLNLENDKNIVSQKDITLFNKSVITITYKSGEINIYQDGVNILSTQVNNFYFNNNKVILNKNKDLNVNIYGLLVYNRVIKNNEMAGIREYFITNSNKNYNNPDINNIQMDNNLYNNNPINTVSPYYNTVNTQEQYSNINDTIFDTTFTNQNTQLSTCAKDCENMCRKFLNLNNGIDKYKECIKNCKNVVYSCETYCDEEGNDSKYCNPNIDTTNNNTVNNKCPIAYKKNNNYYVYVYPNSTYAQELNYSGEKSYGQNIDNARNIYTQNFPNCVIPQELRYNGNKNYLDTCPYTLKQLNPCYIDQCYGVNWNVENYADLNINDKCKKAVSNYCRINYDIDEKCACWNPKYKNSEKCTKMRKFFENPQDYCSPGSFNIEEHPDFSKYIKKDKIPCWGCNLEAPESINEKNN
jgi:hypothetical protein